MLNTRLLMASRAHVWVCGCGRGSTVAVRGCCDRCVQAWVCVECVGSVSVVRMLAPSQTRAPSEAHYLTVEKDLVASISFTIFWIPGSWRTSADA